MYKPARFRAAYECVCVCVCVKERSGENAWCCSKCLDAILNVYVCACGGLCVSVVCVHVCVCMVLAPTVKVQSILPVPCSRPGGGGGQRGCLCFGGDFPRNASLGDHIMSTLPPRHLLPQTGIHWSSATPPSAPSLLTPRTSRFGLDALGLPCATGATGRQRGDRQGLGRGRTLHFRARLGRWE